MSEAKSRLFFAYARFELRRLARRWALWVCFGVCFGFGAFEMLQGHGFPGAALFAPFFALYLGAWGLFEDHRSGALDLLLRGGLPVAQLVLVRAALAALAVGLSWGILLGAGAVLCWFSVSQVAGLLAVSVFWAVVGAALGLFVRAQNLAVALCASLVLQVWWFTQLSYLLLRQPPTEPWPRSVALFLQILGPLPLSETLWGRTLSPLWELGRLLLLCFFFAIQAWLWEKRSILVRRES